MDLKSVLELLKAVDDTDLSKFELNDGDFSLKMERGTGESKTVYVTAPPQISAQIASGPVAAMPTAAPAAEAPASPATAEAPVQQESRGKEIVSPLVGVYHKLSEGKDVKIGDKLKKGDIICMVEAMKLVNEITMPEDGEITWVACEDGDSVEYGQLLFNYI
ncbi:MAG: biotin/lipoyl-containing protein [Christensenella hongkongensis]|uniref:acetyl-CoA carboxylase biotin carboxyl carrier protein n=1 Tax=Christensenella hongkongensis TaxID=270498 RepID=UPI002A75A3FD|nr:biotin/lipoyl-containing protein [Christensenella hongkongensis]MDY3003004.1 biotin/lipoyl-containing protein [Christensenella hongkongensis]